MSKDLQLITILDKIEEQEARLLVWGLTDTCISKDELNNIIDPVLEDYLKNGLDSFHSVGEVVQLMEDRGLIFRAFGITYEGYRSRMAETVRLLFYIRQLFPKHRGKDGWQTGRTLVSDFRFSRRPRKYPDRHVSPGSAINTLSDQLITKTEDLCFRTIVSNRGPGFALADFQVRATKRILASLRGKRPSGTLVSAGTGSGKTLAFYIPALTRIASLILETPNVQWVKCVALYPRTELLKDQFSEIYNEARRLDQILTKVGRKIKIGAFFGATPFSAASLLHDGHRGWERKGDGFRCGFMACPTDNCSGDLIWPEVDIRRSNEHLVCDSCGAELTDDEIILTRTSLQKTPPDIVFTTTEMLNQRISDSWSRHLFGLRPEAAKPPEMMLLDEVHTYSGFHGAQVGYLLRRWKSLVKTPITFVGLSATLRDGARFFSRLTGLYESQIQEVTPKRQEMISEGAEYILALKGDPVSKTSLLSTSIQTLMLISRMLDPANSDRSRGVYGKRVFAFTDDIDVINRLYFGLLDAEGRKSSGGADMARHPNGGLAFLRQPIQSVSRERHGQNWSAPEKLGHDLSDRKRIGRTSSQDPGVISNLDVVVATAALEVGFNDPTVGAVIQHKAPRGVAAYLQRKGRAGRSRKMRPWTILVLSDYGRDRQAYQAYDRLFDPELDVQAIPLGSRYIQHIQGVYSLIDYLGASLPKHTQKGSVWGELAGPITSGKFDRQNLLRDRLRDLIEIESESDIFQKHLTQSLRTSEEDIQSVMWEQPRGLMTTVIPTALRRLETNWRCYGSGKIDFNIPNSPLPEFAPSTLFSDLNLPEVQVCLPPDWIDAEVRPSEPMPITQALRTFTPGRVSRRFGVSHSKVRHWVAPEEIQDAVSQDFEIKSFYSGDLLGKWQFYDRDIVKNVSVLRPFEINPIQPQRQIRDTSNARLIWNNQIVKHTSANTLGYPIGSSWDEIINGVDAYTHGDQQPIEMRRFATASLADIQFERDEIKTRFDFTRDGEPIAIGFSMTVDALRFRISIPSEIDKPNQSDMSEKWHSMRTTRFHSRIWEGEILSVIPNPFLRQWLGQVYFSALTFEALSKNISLCDAATNILNEEASISLPAVLTIVFQSPVFGEDDEDTLATGGGDKLREELDLLLRDKVVLTELHSAALVLWEPVDASWRSWLIRRFKTTFAATVFAAMNNLCPDMENGDLVVDIDSGPLSSEDIDLEGTGNHEVWISETAPGGTGNIEEFIIRYSEDPRRFYSLLSATLEHNEHQIIDHQLFRLLESLSTGVENDQVNVAVKGLRGAQSLKDTEKCLAALRKALKHENFVLFHGFSTALSNRILRPGTSIDTDKFFYHVLSFWRSEEKRLGIELDTRTIAYFFSQDTTVDQILQSAGFLLPEGARDNWRFNTIYGMLWPRGGATRKQGLDLYNPYDELPDAEPLLISSLLVKRATKVLVTDQDWQTTAVSALSESGIVTLCCELVHIKFLSNAVNFFTTNAITDDYLSVFARLEAVRRDEDMIEVDLELAEVAQ